MEMIGRELTIELAREIYAGGWVDGYCSETVGPFRVNEKIDDGYVRWLAYVPEPQYKALPWKSSRPLFDATSPDVSSLFM